MKNTSKIVMVATIIMVVGVALVLGLVLILLAELCCSLFFRRHFRKNSRFSLTNDPSTPQQNGVADAPSSLSSFYSQGVLRAPRSMLFPPNSNVDFEKQTSQEIQEQVPSDARVLGHLYSSQKLQHEEQFMYISNPIYGNSKVDTPFVTPDTSPSRFEKRIKEDEDEEEDDDDDDETPPLTPMKKLPAEGCSVPLRDVRSLCTTGSDSNSNIECISTSSLGSPSTSPSL